MKKTLYIALGAATAAMSMAQTVTVPGTVNFGGAIGSGDNSVLSGLSPVTSAFVVGGGVTFGGANLTSVAALTYGTDATMRLKNSGYPALYSDVDFSGLYDTFTAISVPVNSVRSFLSGGSLSGAAIAVASTWSVECWDSYEDGAGADETGSGISFTVNGLPAAAYTFTAAGPIQSLANGPFNPVNPTLTGPAVGTAFALGTQGISSGTYTQNFAGDWPVDTVVIIRNSARPADWAFTRPLPVFADVPSAVVSSNVVPVGGPMLGQTMASGTTMSFAFSNNPMETGDVAGGLEATITAFTLKLTAAGTPAAPPSAVDAGTVNAPVSPLLTSLGVLGAGQVKWVKFTLGSPVGASFGGTYLDAFTSGTGADDTLLGVYNDKGYLVSSDDDDDDGLFSALSFGAGGNAANGAGVAFDGRDGDLPAGTYYAAVGQFFTTFNNGFSATSDGTGTAASVNLVLRSNIVSANQALTGTLNLSNTGVFAFNRSIAYTVKQGTATIGSGSVTATASASSFNISLPSSFVGAATIVWDGSSFLVRKTNINLTGSNLAVGSVTMQNGDVDNSGEVDAADIDQVIANFGSVANITSDVDVSGEVDAADIDVVIANFGGTDD